MKMLRFFHTLTQWRAQNRPSKVLNENCEKKKIIITLHLSKNVTSIKSNIYEYFFFISCLSSIYVIRHKYVSIYYPIYKHIN